MGAEPASLDLGRLQAEAIGNLTKRDFRAAIDRSAMAAAAMVESIGPLEQCTPEQLPQVQRAAALFGELALAYTLWGDVARSAGPMEQAIRYGQRARALMPTPERL